MSSFAKAAKAQRRAHRERAQPLHRSKFGLLEKDKDWKTRRDDYKSKQKRLRALAIKARERNPDEFYFSMVKQQTKNGRHVLKDDELEHLTAEQLQVYRSQDLGYVGMRLTQEKRQIERLQSDLHMLVNSQGSGHGKHTVFVDSKQQLKSFDAAKHFDTPRELLDRPFNRLHTKQLQETELVMPEARARKKMNRARSRAYEELAERKDRVTKIAKVANTLQLQKNLAEKGARTKVKGGKGKAPVYKWKQQRKR
ncbi:uncharacterized protein MONBRDRAFT_33162 [Monosiga brevicollis MX1]|uniref:U3 small nucleolar RNA-associated protein 11 n=1 Tax=Monosiga brevicollis TaxID=81824 RepID=A9V414_MONBE|nr:uncharacterized protein MONBRDRAFT_33162 [Monosiga brevicollis MX1]EDQ87902.1 predicted protein [Monosiga brevicollis MX1]|eukprot:XP_001747435.1 hypothetical protein [Monosiga brevicollis MX1]